MSNTAHLTQHNVFFLQQASEMLGDLPDTLFGTARPPYFSSGIGPHLRHVLDHYHCFLRDVGSGQIDYDQRIRNTELESNRAFALGAVLETMDKLSELNQEDGPLDVKIESDFTLT